MMNRSMISTSAVIIPFFILSLFLAVSHTSAASLQSLSSIKAGDLIRGQSFSAVYYYGKDGFRYVFPNDKAFFTWYSNFDSVKWISDSDMTKIQIGGNVTYKPGVKMIKINSDARVYVVGLGGVLRAIKSEAVAKELYGANWNKQIDDVPDGFFGNYQMGSSLDEATSFSVSAEKADAASIDADKKLQAPTVVTISDSSYSPSVVTIKVGGVVRFVNSGSLKHSASEDGGNWGTGTLQVGDVFSKRFKEKGLFQFHDAYGNAKGTLLVE